jgi:acylphosphatase
MQSPLCAPRRATAALPSFVWTENPVYNPVATRSRRGRMIGRMVHYSGIVQGVGFRAVARELARKWPVTGWVKNLADGRVQLLVEGTERDVEDFLQELRDYWKGHVEGEDVQVRQAAGQQRSFEVVR